MTHTQEKKHTAKTPCKRDQMSYLTDRLHSTTINMYKEPKETTLEEVKETQ